MAGPGRRNGCCCRRPAWPSPQRRRWGRPCCASWRWTPTRMAANIAAHDGYLQSEPVMRALADRVGKHTAHQVVYEASMKGIESGESFRHGAARRSTAGRDHRARTDRPARCASGAGCERGIRRSRRRTVKKPVVPTDDDDAVRGGPPAAPNWPSRSTPARPGPRSSSARRRCTPRRPALRPAAASRSSSSATISPALGFGGNKFRALEYLLADAAGQGCDSVVTGAGPQSNWSMLAALSCDPARASNRTSSATARRRSPSGNLLLQQRLGVAVQFTGDPDKASVDAAIDASGRSTARRRDAGPTRSRVAAPPRWVRWATSAPASRCPGSSPNSVSSRPRCGCQPAPAAPTPGWPQDKALLQAHYDVVGVTVSRPGPECVQRIRSMAMARRAGCSAPTSASRRRSFVTAGSAPGTALRHPRATRRSTWSPGRRAIFLDPVFGAKAMAALIDGCRAGEVQGPVVFLVTGGGPSLFACAGAADRVRRHDARTSSGTDRPGGLPRRRRQDHQRPGAGTGCGGLPIGDR